MDRIPCLGMSELKRQHLMRGQTDAGPAKTNPGIG
tara:strand:- start:176 stop:280 length:105 start_codon:yes stop_codon:yes gene_type:complete